MLFVVRLVDLSVIEGLDLMRGSNIEIIRRLRQVFDFLPKETKIEVADGIVTIDIPDPAAQDKPEADRLHIKAIQRAKQGDYRKAVGIWERVIELDPTNLEARRNLGMAYVELQEAMGSAELIRNKARDLGAELREYRLEAQFRCAGSDAFVNWIDNTLGVAKTATQVWNQREESFELKVFSSAKALDAAIALANSKCPIRMRSFGSNHRLGFARR